MKKRRAYLSAVVMLIIALLGWRKFSNREALPEAHLKIYGIVNMADGIGRQSVELIKALKDDMSVAFVPTRPSKMTDVPKEILPYLSGEQKRCKSKVVLLEDVLGMPGHSPWKKMAKRTDSDQIRIAYSMFESTRIPAEWVHVLNSHFDLVAVPDLFLVDVYHHSGVEIPVVVLPLGLYLDEFFEVPLRTAARTPMVFGNLSTAIERKNHLALVRGFVKAFGNRSDVCLRINYRDGEESVIKKVKEEIRRLKVDNIHFTRIPLDKRAYLNYFKTIDCYVSLSKAEGFSIQPREAMALGIPVIATDNTAQTTLCKHTFVRSVVSRTAEPARFFWGSVHGKHFNCDVNEVAEAFLDIYNNYDNYLQKAHAGREWVRRYEFANLKNLYRNLIKPKKVLLGDEDRVTEEYLMTTSQELYDKYMKL